jgi:hypothetical protein
LMSQYDNTKKIFSRLGELGFLAHTMVSGSLNAGLGGTFIIHDLGLDLVHE